MLMIMSIFVNLSNLVSVYMQQLSWIQKLFFRIFKCRFRTLNSRVPSG